MAIDFTPLEKKTKIDFKPIEKKPEKKPGIFEQAKMAAKGLLGAYSKQQEQRAEGLKKVVVEEVKPLVKETRANIEEYKTLPPEEKKKTISDTGKRLLEGGKSVITGISDFVETEIPKTAATLLKVGAQNFGISYVPKTTEPKKFKELRTKTAQWADDIVVAYDNKAVDRMKELGIGTDTSMLDPVNFGYKLGSGAASMGLAVGVAILTKNPTLAASALGILEGSGTYNDSQQKLREEHPEMSEEEINRRSLLNASVDTTGITILEGFGLDFLFRTYGKGRLYKGAINSITETVQETSQTIWSNIVAKFGYDKTRNIFDGVAETILTTFPLGFFGGAVLEGGADIQITTENIPEEAVDKVAKDNKISKEEAKEIIKAVLPAINEEVKKTPQKIEAEESKEKVVEDIKSGKSKTEITLELSQKLGIEEAKKVVDEVSETTKPEIKPEVKPEIEPKAKPVALEETLAEFKKIDEKLLEKTPVNLQEEFVGLQKSFEENTQKITKEITELRKQVESAAEKSTEKKQAKMKLESKRTELRNLEKSFNEDLIQQAKDTRAFIFDYIKKETDLEDEQATAIVNDIAKEITGGVSKRSVTEIIKEKIQAPVKKVESKPKTQKETVEEAAKETKAKKEIPSDLLDDASKYTSADAYIDAHKKLYHGTSETFEEFSADMIGEVQPTDWGAGFYFTDDEKAAKSYAKVAGGNIVMERYFPTVEFAEIERFEKDLDFQNALDNEMDTDALRDFLKKKGFDGLRIRNKAGHIEYVVFDAQKIKTEAQMREIWEQANTKKPTEKKITTKREPIKETSGIKIPQKKAKSIYKKADVISKGTYKGETYTTNSYIIEFSDVVDVEPTTEQAPNENTIEKMVSRIGDITVGQPERTVRDEDGDIVVILHAGKDDISIDVDYYNYLSKKYPTADWKMAAGEITPVGIYENEQLVAAIIPRSPVSIEKSTTLEDLKREKETAEMEEVVKEEEKGYTKEYEEGTKHRKPKSHKEEISKPMEAGGGEPGGAREAVEGAGEGERRESERPPQRGGEPRKRPTTRITNEEISKTVSEITTISENGEVEITGEITDEILEIANQYNPGGKTKEGRGILDEYYTNSKIVDIVKSLFDFSAKNLKIIEPSVGTGNFLYAVPEIGNHQIAALEINETTAKIAKIFHPTVKVFNQPFERIFIDEQGKSYGKDNLYIGNVDFIIGNPPYGEHRGKYLGLGEEPTIKKYEDYFIKRGVDLLKDGGYLVMVVPSGFLQRADSKTKQRIAKESELINAFRLPNGIFEGTDIGTDIIVIKKGKPGDIKLFSNGEFFNQYPENILGIQKQKKNRFGKMEDYVDGTLDDAINLFYQNKNAREAIKLLSSLGIEKTEENIESAEKAIDEAGEKAKDIMKEEKKKGKEVIKKKVVKKAKKEGEAVSLTAQFEGEFTDAELEMWRNTQPDGSLKEKMEGSNYMDGKWYIDFNYAQGDIYSKLHKLEYDLSVKNITKEQYEIQKKKLEKVLPKRESIDEVKLSPNTGFVSDLKLGTEENDTLRSAFLKWLQSLPSGAFGSSSQWEVREFTNNVQVRGNDKDRNERVRTRRKETAENLFSKFLMEGLTEEQKSVVEDAYNETFNFYHTPDYKKVPMFSNIMPTFKGSTFKLRDVQKHGIGRLVNTGVGILAHDVGFGKTISGVVALNEIMHRGWAKRPIIVAPNENVYRQWIDTIEELIPDAKFNLLGNLGGDFKGDLSTLRIEEGSITLVTYTGFTRLSFSDETYSSLSGKFQYIADDLEKDKSKRGEAKAKAETETKEGRMRKGARVDVSFEKLGFDHLTFDEVHNANHIVSKVKLEKGKASEFNRFSLRPSDLGIKTWLASQYIQKQNDGRNVNLLSATPFTNHPLEYYSIISLVADKSLEKMKLQNVNDFFGTFMEAESEYEFRADGTYQKKTDIRRFRNYRQFRKLLNTYIDFKEGDEKGIDRPNRVQQTYEIPQNELGLEMEAKAQEMFKDDESKEGKGAKVLRAITELRKIAFSPYASKFAEDITVSDYKKFVENSPKIKVLMALIAQNKKDKNEAGQIIYVDQVGVEFLPLMKEYLIKELGYKPGEVEIISGTTLKPKRVTIQESYNAGDVKIILGSEAIKEGMNLQKNTSDMYILSLPWNFTQLRQVIGRAWRQGNRWKNVRINNLFIQDSIDIFLAQKNENKQRRYEASVKSEDNEIDIGDILMSELKFDLVKDPSTRAKLELQAEQERLSQEITQERAELAFATRKLERINNISDELERYKENLKNEKEEYWIEKYEDTVKKLQKQYDEEIAKLREKGIEVEKLVEMKETGEKKIDTLKEKEETLKGGFEERMKEISAKMPERKPFSNDIVASLVSERAEANKTFYELKKAESDEVVVAETVEKPIKSVTGKVVKKKKTTRVVKSKRVAQKKTTKETAMLKILTAKNLTVQEKVDTLLEKKQEGKKFKDVGERVAGSKKENAIIQAVIEHGDSDILRVLADELGKEAVLAQLNKQKILEDMEVPTRDVEMKKGTPAWLAGYKVNVFNSIGRVPKTVQKRRRYYTEQIVTEDVLEDFIVKYPQMLRDFVAKLNDISTIEDYREFVEKYRYNLGEVKDTEGDERIIGTNVMGATIQNAIGGGGRFIRDAKNIVREIEQEKEVIELLKSGEPKIDRGYMIGGEKTDLFTGMSEYGRRTKTFRSKEEAKKSIQNYLKEKPEAIKEAEERLEDFQTDYDRFVPEKKITRVETDLKHGNFKAIEEYDVKDSRFAKAYVKTDNLMKVYGFKSAQLGNYMDDASSKEHIVQTMASMEDMSIILGIDFAKIANEMGLSIAFGARGGGGNAVAHFEPTNKIINITKKRGDGSFGHEFMHALDYILGAQTRRGKWSAGNGYGRCSYTAGDYESMILTGALKNGVKVESEVEFKPSEDVDQEDWRIEEMLKLKQEGVTFEEVIERAVGNKANLQRIADVYRKEFTANVKETSNDFYKKSLEYGGGKTTSYWVRKEELWARAFQAYLEDKLEESGIKNNYLTRKTKDISVYPQGKERIEINKLFDNLFNAFKQKYPTQEKIEPRFKKVEKEVARTDGYGYLEDAKKRLGVDFDVMFVDSILAQDEDGLFEAEGVELDNTIAVVKKMAEFTEEHELVHLTLRNIDRIKIFGKNGLTQEKVMRAKADQMGIDYDNATTEDFKNIDESLAKEFEAYMKEARQPKGIIRRFFNLLKTMLTRFARVIGITNGDIIKDYYEILDEGQVVDGEMVRLENKGTLESYVEDGILDLRERVLVEETGYKNVSDNLMGFSGDGKQQRGFVEQNYSYVLPVVVEFNDGTVIHDEIKGLNKPHASERAIRNWVGAKIYTLEETKDARFKVLDEGDKRLAKLKKEYNELDTKTTEIEENIGKWKQDLENEIQTQAEQAKVVDETEKDTKELAKYTKRTPLKGELTNRGIEEAEILGFSDMELAQQEISDYLKRKTELVETRNRLRTLRRDIASARKEGKSSASALRIIERRLKLRKKLLERNDYYVNLGVKRGKKQQMKMIRHRGKVLRSMQDFIGISDHRAKEIIGGIGRQRIHTMSETEFNNFMVEFVNKARELVDILDERDSVRALIQEMDFQKEDNVRKAMGLPSIAKMTQEQAERFNRVLSKYQLGDVFLTQRQLETIQRTNWGDVRTEREMFEKITKDTGITKEDLKNVRISRTFQKFKNWLVLSRSNPMFAWLVDRRIKADIQKQAELVAFEEEMNPIARAARKSRKKTIGEKIAQAFAPTDKIVFDYIESENKEKFAKDQKMTPEELDFAHFLIARLYEPARLYMQNEYAMKDRRNYITHIRRTILETFIDAIREGRGIRAGIIEATREILTSQKEDEAVFKILGEKTGEVLAFEKWFKFAMPRTGQLVPTKNVVRASLAYASAYYNKVALDELTPEAIAMTKIQESIKGYTPKGLPVDPSVSEFVNQWINDAKGRKIDFLTAQGDWFDNAFRIAISWTAFKYLGFRPLRGIINFIGEFVGTMNASSKREVWRGIKRSFNIKKAHRINQTHKYFTGRNPLIEVFDPQYGITTRIKNASMVLFSLASFFNNRFYLRAKMTEEEWQEEIMQDPQLLEIIKEMSKFRTGTFYVKSLVGNTTTGSIFSQFATWAYMNVITTISNFHQIYKHISEKGWKEGFTSKETRELGRIVVNIGLVVFMTQILKSMVDDDDDEENDAWKSVFQELNTYLGSFQAVIGLDYKDGKLKWEGLEGRAPIFREFGNFMTFIAQLLTLEKYKADGEGYGIGDLKAIRTGEKLILPTFLQEILDYAGLVDRDLQNTKERLVAEGLEGEFDPEKIVSIVFASQLEKRKEDGDSEEEINKYRDKKIGEVKQLYTLRKEYNDNKMANLIYKLKNKETKEVVEKMIEYTKEVGKDKAWEEIKAIRADRNLYVNPEKKTGGLISSPLFKAYVKERRKL